MINQNLPKQLHNYILNNGTKKFKFWNNFLLNRAYIYNTDNNKLKITSNHFERITEIKNAFDSIYDKDNWGFSFEYIESKYTVLTGVLVYFPILEIENSETTEYHVKKDVYLFFKLLVDEEFNKGEIKIEAPKIFSTTFNEFENMGLGERNYETPKFFIHPHFRTWTASSNNLVSYLKTNTFCYGAGDSGTTFSGIFLRDQPKEYIEFYLHTVNEFIKIESEDGGPYIRGRNLLDFRKKDNTEEDIYTSKDVVRLKYKNFIALNINIFIDLLKYCDFSVYETEVVVKNTFNFKMETLDFLESNKSKIEHYDEILYFTVYSIHSKKMYIPLRTFRHTIFPAIASKNKTKKPKILIDYYDKPFVFEKREDRVEYKRPPLQNTEEKYSDYQNLQEKDFNIIIDIFIDELKKALNEKIKKRNERYLPTRNAYV